MTTDPVQPDYLSVLSKHAPQGMPNVNMYYMLGHRDALAAVCTLSRVRGPHEAVQQVAQDLLTMDPTHCHTRALLSKSGDKLPDPIDVIRRLFEVGCLEDHFYAVRDSECQGWEGPRMLAWGKACEDAAKLLAIYKEPQCNASSPTSPGVSPS